MDAGTGYTDGMTEREPRGGSLVRAVAYVRVSSEKQPRRIGHRSERREEEVRSIRSFSPSSPVKIGSGATSMSFSWNRVVSQEEKILRVETRRVLGS